MIKILLVDDHVIVRMGIRSLLDAIDGIKVVGEADSGEEAINLARETHPNVVLMDVRMPGIGGLEAAKRLIRIDPDVKIIALTACLDDPFPARFLQAGAVGYLTKDSSITEMVSAIRKVHAGQRYLNSEVAQQLALKSMGDASEQSPLDILSERELQVMLMITSGQSVPDISEKLHLSSKTVNSHRYRIFAKLKIHNDVELTHFAIRHGMLSHDFQPEQNAEDSK